MIWRVNRESAVVLGGTCAILLQFAHPLVAAGVRDHSDFSRDPIGRLRRTYGLTLRLVFGTRYQAKEAARAINRRHQAVQGPAYSANDPELLLWVQATLVYSALTAYAAFVAPPTDQERDGYYQDTKKLGRLLGVRPEIYPPDIHDFDAYFRSMLDGGPVRVGSDARALAQALLRLRIPLVPALAFEPLRIITAGLLPERLRQDYGLPWGAFQRGAFRVCRRALRALIPVAPDFARTLPPARAAFKRIQPA